MNTDTKAVAQFEAWADDQGFKLDRTVQGDDYQDLRTQGPWEAWQASIAARQPGVLIAQKVGDYRVTVAEDTITVSHGRDIVFAYSAGDAEPVIARQPGAQEPVGKLIYRWDQGPHGEWEFAPEKPVIAVLSRTPKIGGQFADQRFDVYAAPPAQGTD